MAFNCLILLHFQRTKELGRSSKTSVLNNDMSINNPSDGVNIALHNIDGSTIKQVQINNPGDVYTKALDATTKSAVYDFKASYVRAVADQTATAGYVKTNTAYTITYQ